jgi:DNA helicase-2/ATP-dependent DNA helicase PcrA
MWAAAAGGSHARTPNAGPPPQFRIGDDVLHAAFGEGVVTGLEPDGIVVVRFAGDRSERKLLAGIAPVTRR